MFIKKLDYLSRNITFYHFGLLSHSSIFSGIISIISFLILIILAIFFFLDFIEKKDPKAFSFNSFVNDAGTFYLNSSSLFHFVGLSSANSNYSHDGFDFTYFRIIGFDSYFTAYTTDKNLSKYDHWLYGICNKENDIEGIEYLFDNNYDFFKRSACIRKYFNSAEQKYYDTWDSNFKWPSISHGSYNPNGTLYNLVVEKCKEDTIGFAKQIQKLTN